MWLETSSDDCQTKLTTAANAGDYSTLPDIVLMQANSYQKYLEELSGCLHRGSEGNEYQLG